MNQFVALYSARIRTNHLTAWSFYLDDIAFFKVLDQDSISPNPIILVRLKVS